MDTTDPEIQFNDQGVCNHCRNWDRFSPIYIITGEAGDNEIRKIAEKIKHEERDKEYDCVVGLSGGVDSSFAALRAKQLGLRVLAIHVDSGWNSELAVMNIENMVKKLKIDLTTFVCDWEEMRDLQISFFKAGVANCDIPQDHAFIAAVYKMTEQYGLRYMIGGFNFATECILPAAWGYKNTDLKHIKSIHERFGKIPLKKYPTLGFFEYFYFYPCFKGFRNIRILNYMEYRKEEAKRILSEEFDWRDYGGKHYESQFTKIFQSYYLPTKFGYDKRKAHLSSLIVSGQLARELALKELSTPLYDPEKLHSDIEFITKKLGLTIREWDEIMKQPASGFRDYPNNEWLYKLKKSFFDKIFRC